MIDQAAFKFACLVAVINLFLLLNAFRSSINMFFNSLSKRVTNLLVAGLL
jgi:hypothetical protein